MWGLRMRRKRRSGPGERRDRGRVREVKKLGGRRGGMRGAKKGGLKASLQVGAGEEGEHTGGKGAEEG